MSSESTKSLPDSMSVRFLLLSITTTPIKMNSVSLIQDVSFLSRHNELSVSVLQEVILNEFLNPSVNSFFFNFFFKFTLI